MLKKEAEKEEVEQFITISQVKNKENGAVINIKAIVVAQSEMEEFPVSKKKKKLKLK